MIPLLLPGFPKLGQDWDPAQSRDLNELWKDIKRTIDSMRRSTGVTGSIATGAVIPHNLGAIPSLILITPQDGTPTNFFASSLSSTSFTLNFSGGGSHSFGWSAEI